MTNPPLDGLPATLGELLRRAAETWPACPALRLHGPDGWELTYAQLEEAARRAAAYLRTQGVGQGDRVLLWGPNRPEWVVAFFGVLLLGGVAVPLDLHSREELLCEIERQTAPVHMVAGKEQLASLTGEHVAATSLDSLRRLIETCPSLPVGAVSVEPDDVAELVY